MRSAVCDPAAACPSLSPWVRSGHETRISVEAEIDGILSTVHEAMAEAGYSGRALLEVRLALEEALLNALKHGNRGDRRKHVSLHGEVTAHRVLLTVEDQGQGFDPAGL